MHKHLVIACMYYNKQEVYCMCVSNGRFAGEKWLAIIKQVVSNNTCNFRTTVHVHVHVCVNKTSPYSTVITHYHTTVVQKWFVSN